MVFFVSFLGTLGICDSLLSLTTWITVSFPRVTQILKGALEGAPRILPALRVLSSLLSSCSDSVPLYSFCREAGLPGLLLSLLKHSQESNSIQQVSAASQERKSQNAENKIQKMPIIIEKTSEGK